jgi:hypothetical protein
MRDRMGHQQKSNVPEGTFPLKQLTDLGITKKKSSLWQQLA